MDIIIVDFCDTVFKEFCKKIKHSVLFIDSNMIECLHWSGGFAQLMSAGVKYVKEFSPFEKAPDNCNKAVFLTASLVTNENVRKTVKMVIENSDKCLDYCLLATVASYQSHVSAALRFRDTGNETIHSGRRIFDDFEDEMLSWMGSKNFTSEVIHVPLFMGHLAEDAFLTLPFPDISPSLDSKCFHSDFYRLNSHQQITIDIFSSCLSSLFSALSIKEDIYCVGPYSSLIGTHLVNLPAAKNRRKSAVHNASLLLIDRTADLVAPLLSLESSALDQIMFSNKPLVGHYNERSILISDENNTDLACFTVFEHCKDPEAGNLLQQFIEKPLHDCIGLAVNKLNSLAKSNGVSLATSKRAVKSVEHTLAELIKKLLVVDNFDAPPYFQACTSLLAVVENNVEISRSVEVLSEMELIYALPDALSKFIQFSEEKSLSFEFDVKCLILLYSLAAGNSLNWSTHDIEDFLLFKLRQEYQNDPIFVQTGAIVVVQNIVAKLKNIARLRDVIPAQKPSTPYLVNLLERIFDSRQPALPELACKTSGLADALKSSISMFLNVAKPSRPNDTQTIIIFVIGGICGWEIAEVRRKLLDLKITNCNIIVGSTKLISAKDVLTDFFVNGSSQ